MKVMLRILLWLICKEGSGDNESEFELDEAYEESDQSEEYGSDDIAEEMDDAPVEEEEDELAPSWDELHQQALERRYCRKSDANLQTTRDEILEMTTEGESRRDDDIEYIIYC